MDVKSHLSDFLIQKREGAAPPRLDVRFEPSLPARILDSDEPHPECDDLPESAGAEGQTFVICYVNGRGVRSLRRITLLALKRTSEERILLHARCAETRDEMRFRADRIVYCMDVSGQVHEPPTVFLAEVFDLGPADVVLLESDIVGRPPALPQQDPACGVLRQQLRHDLILLTAMAESDGHISLTESDAILSYIRHRAEVLGIDLDDVRQQKMQGFVRRFRPTPHQISESIDEISSRPSKAQMEIMTVCAEVMLADGEVHAAEVQLLEQIRSQLS